jgi:hypothetical protein
MPTERGHEVNEVNDNNDLQIKLRQEISNENDGKNQMDQFIRNIKLELRCNICFDIFTKVIDLMIHFFFFCFTHHLGASQVRLDLMILVLFFKSKFTL